jgi:hypothetical protein
MVIRKLFSDHQHRHCIPEKYREAYEAMMTALFRRRVRLYCLLVMAIYLFSTVVEFFLDPGSWRIQELGLWALLLVSTAVLFYAVRSTIRLSRIKIYGLFSVLLCLVLIFKLGILYVDVEPYDSALLLPAY